MAKRKTYLLQNASAGYCGNFPLFWKESGCGYTPYIDDAKRWSFREAKLQIRSSRGSHDFRMIDLKDAERHARRVVSIEDLLT